jgi:hypothetical protein
VTHLLVILVLGSFAWGMKEGLSLDRRRAEAFNVLVFGEIGYALTTRFIKASTLHPRALHGNPWCFLSIGLTAALQVGGIMVVVDCYVGWCYVGVVQRHGLDGASSATQVVASIAIGPHIVL